MPTVVFAQYFKKYLDCPSREVTGRRVADALDEVFSNAPQLRNYVLDDQGRLRHHVAIFVDGDLILDRIGLSDAIESESRIDVMQALSGG
jgi:sulfur carrier protein ThiS